MGIAGTSGTSDDVLMPLRSANSDLAADNDSAAGAIGCCGDVGLVVVSREDCGVADRTWISGPAAVV